MSCGNGRGLQDELRLEVDLPADPLGGVAFRLDLDADAVDSPGSITDILLSRSASSQRSALVQNSEPSSARQRMGRSVRTASAWGVVAVIMAAHRKMKSRRMAPVE